MTSASVCKVDNSWSFVCFCYSCLKIARESCWFRTRCRLCSGPGDVRKPVRLVVCAVGGDMHRARGLPSLRHPAIPLQTLRRLQCLRRCSFSIRCYNVCYCEANEVDVWWWRKGEGQRSCVNLEKRTQCACWLVQWRRLLHEPCCIFKIVMDKDHRFRKVLFSRGGLYIIQSNKLLYLSPINYLCVCFCQAVFLL